MCLTPQNVAIDTLVHGVYIATFLVCHADTLYFLQWRRSITSMLLDWPSLEIHRKKSRILFKVLNKLIHIPTQSVN